ncbi:cobalt-precorrin-6A reductase [Intrasporangium sp. YIM S08009]|uniref:cobalt-precorrin-6A reductase n=1 Tax=Intrasporangium zincisolvens TaxID=3080018 RepID=UPI002B05C41B|nr:cobalt-precorrin-6A reductase [Intrasporangium sp. YIM S08009]
MRVLLLGGTGEARALAAVLVGADVDVESSLAGRVSRPALPVGPVRTGGFGGVDGLAGHLTDGGFDAVVDATHPFAAGISGNAAAACRATGIPLVRLQRAGWDERPGAEAYTWVDSVEAARVAAEAIGTRPFVTTGRQQLDAYARWDDRYVLARVVDPPEWPVPASWEVLLTRGPFTLAAETALLTSRRVDVLLTKDSGGPLTEAKLDAADALGVPVVVVRRPPVPDGVEVVEDVEAAARWVAGASSRT